MFTGIIKNTGKVAARVKGRLIFKANQLSRRLRAGSSIAVDGVCLTIAKLNEQTFIADLMPETLKKTALRDRKSGDLLNLELPMPATGCFEGHIVTGHVDGVGVITKIQKLGNSRLVTVQIPTALVYYVISMGSIAINGVSLTVIKIKKNLVTVGIIPYTWRRTNFHALRAGDKVNIETDILAKYLKKWRK